MPVRLGVKVDDDQAQALFRRLRRRTSNLSSFFRGPLDSAVTDFLRRQFETKGREGGDPWAPTSPLTRLLKSRAGHGRAGPDATGQDTRRMWAAFVKSGAPGSVRTIRDDYYERGADAPRTRGGVTSVPALFQEGYAKTVFGRRVPGRVPARPVIPSSLPGSLIRRFEREFDAYLSRTV